MASSIRVKGADLGDQLDKILTKYADDVNDLTRAAVRKTATYARDKLKETSPKLTGGYAASWSVSNSSETAYRSESIVYNKTKPGLAHLLENGHALRGGGRVRAIPHIAPVEDEALEVLEDAIKKAVPGV